MKAATMQLMDLREATNILNAHATSIIGKNRLYDEISKPGVPEEIGNVIEKLITNLEAETKNARIISIVVMEEVTRHFEQIVAGFPAELAELSQAIARTHTATDEASKVTLAHKEKSLIKHPEENPEGKAISDFLASYRSNMASKAKTL
jgi:hypothetical protein